ncbi:MAG: Ig-like domain-containing protein, partial [Flaviflexus sp.]|nr:Ig-like domain-containing protein [Flaviflexus sp.]
VTTQVGVAPVLPDTVVVHWNDGTTTNEAVTWDEVAVESYAAAGTFEVNGVTIDDLQVSVNVTVVAEADNGTAPDPDDKPSTDKPST